MNLDSKPQTRVLYLLVGLLLLVAAGVLVAAPHDHDPNEFCRVCSVSGRVEALVEEVCTATPELEHSGAPDVGTATTAAANILAATPLRGPPSIS
jgi:hypothetical protein